MIYVFLAELTFDRIISGLMSFKHKRIVNAPNVDKARTIALKGIRRDYRDVQNVKILQEYLLGQMTSPDREN